MAALIQNVPVILQQQGPQPVLNRYCRIDPVRRHESYASATKMWKIAALITPLAGITINGLAIALAAVTGIPGLILLAITVPVALLSTVGSFGFLVKTVFSKRNEQIEKGVAQEWTQIRGQNAEEFTRTLEQINIQPPANIDLQFLKPVYARYKYYKNIQEDNAQKMTRMEQHLGEYRYMSADELDKEGKRVLSDMLDAKTKAASLRLVLADPTLQKEVFSLFRITRANGNERGKLTIEGLGADGVISFDTLERMGELVLAARLHLALNPL